jgi:hypothetical protein
LIDPTHIILEKKMAALLQMKDAAAPDGDTFLIEMQGMLAREKGQDDSTRQGVSIGEFKLLKGGIIGNILTI